MSFSTFDCTGLGSVGVAGVDGGGTGIGVDGAGIGVDGAGNGTGSGSAIGVDGAGIGVDGAGIGVDGAGISVDGGRGICCRSCTDDWNCGNDCTLEKKIICKQSIMNMHNKYMYIIPVYYLPCLARCFVAETSTLG